jgi:DNA-binding CsgD family transcriptional regulator
VCDFPHSLSNGFSTFPRVRRRLLGARFRRRDDSPPSEKSLTPRERVAVGQIVTGASSKEAARRLGISPRTVDFHRANVMRKLGAKNAADLVRKVLGE